MTQTRLEPGAIAPDFQLKDADGCVWRLSSLHGQKVIVYFYPVDDTPGCTREACDFRDNKEELQRAGYVILGISPQGADSKRAFVEKYNLNFPLLIDEDMKVAQLYGTIREDSETYKGIPLGTLRSTFVVDEEGRIVQALYGVKSRGHVGGLIHELAV